MPRGNRYHEPGHIWHITERCHRRQFLLKFVRDRWAWIHWLYEARRRFGLCVLNYQVTSNHVHLLAHDQGGEAVARSMQLIAGATGQAYNRRKRRRGAFWEGCYHATAVDTEQYLARCLTYIDLNMVRAGAVHHPREWPAAGYHEIQQPRGRYRIIDRDALCQLLGVAESQLAGLQTEWIEAALVRGRLGREPQWSEAVAVGCRAFVEGMQAELNGRARFREIEEVDGVAVLRESPAAYGSDSGIEMAALSAIQTSIPGH